MKGYVTNIEQAAIENTDYRRVVYTAQNCQLVLMSIAPGCEIGEEKHDLDQFIRVEQGTGTAILDGVEHTVTDGSAVVVPAGTLHNIVNTSPLGSLKLYTLYAPPQHRDGTVEKTKADEVEEHFDGKTTE